MKICDVCHKEKPSECFSKRAASKDGLAYDCKDCAKAYKKAYLKTPKGWAKKKYSDMVFRCNSNDWHGQFNVVITQEEFIDFVHANWEKIKNMKWPSIDRIDNKKGYEIGNLQILEHTENSGKDKRRAVFVDGVGRFNSMVEACARLGVTKNAIFLAIKLGTKCKGNRVFYAS